MALRIQSHFSYLYDEHMDDAPKQVLPQIQFQGLLGRQDGSLEMT